MCYLFVLALTTFLNLPLYITSMTFENEKWTFLTKLDKSKKGGIDDRCRPVIDIINKNESYYTTSSCSGRVYLWQGKGKKNETHWLRVSHDLIDESFFEIKETQGAGGGSIIWLRLEGFILHIACKDLHTANKLLQSAKNIYKKSSILTVSNKIVVEIKGSELLEMPFFGCEGERGKKPLFSGNIGWLVGYINGRFKDIWEGITKFERELEKK